MAKKQQVNYRDAGLAQVNATNKIAAELVGKIYQAFCKDDKALIDDINDYLVKNTRAVLLVARHKCPYILHSVCYLMLGQGCADVLKRMSVENVRVLKECISIATSRERPDGKSLAKMLESVDDEIMLQSGAIANSVSLFWDDVNAELNTWDATVNMHLGKSSGKNKVYLTTQELCDWLGLEGVKDVYKIKCKLVKTHPEIKTWFENLGNQGNLFQAEHFEAFKILVDEMYQANTTKNKPQPSGTWTILELAKRIGVSGENDEKKRQHVFELKYVLKKKFPYVVDYFTQDGQYFKAECFDEFKKLIAVRRGSSITESQNLWTKQELATRLGFKNEHSIDTEKWKIKKNNPELAKKIDSWFVYVNNGKGTLVLMFKAECFEELKALFTQGKKKSHTPTQKSVKVPAKETVKRPRQKTGNANPVQEIICEDAHPVDMLGVKALEAKVAALTKMLKEAAARYDEILVKLSNAKPVERPELLHQMEQANNEVMAVEKDLDTANALQNEKLAKLDAVRAADEAKRLADAALADIDAKITEFLKSHQR